MFNPVALYGYLLPTVYLFMAYIVYPDLFLCGYRTWICLDIIRFYEEQRQPSSGSAWPACQKTVNREVSIQFAQQSVTAVTAPPLVGCVVWSPYFFFFLFIDLLYYILLFRLFTLLVHQYFVIFIVYCLYIW